MSRSTDVHLPGYQPTTDGNQKQIRLAAKALANARRPVIYAGGGVVAAEAAADLTELATADRLPVTCTVMGLGAFPAPHEQWLGMLGMHGTRTANYAMDEADLIVAIGARFDDRITGKLSEFAPRAKFIHIDVDPAEISKNVPAHIPIVGDAHNILPRLTAEYRALAPDPARLDEWWARIRCMAAAPSAGLQDSTDNEIKPQYMIKALYEATGGDAIVPATSASTRCGPPSTTTSPSRAAGSTRAAWERWALGCRRRWGRRSAAPIRRWSASPATARSR